MTDDTFVTKGIKEFGIVAAEGKCLDLFFLEFLEYINQANEHNKQLKNEISNFNINLEKTPLEPITSQFLANQVKVPQEIAWNAIEWIKLRQEKVVKNKSLSHKINKIKTVLSSQALITIS